MRISTSKGFVVVNYNIMLAEIKAPASKKAMPSLAYTFTADINSATVFENYEHARTAWRCVKFKRDLDLIDIIK